MLEIIDEFSLENLVWWIGAAILILFPILAKLFGRPAGHFDTGIEDLRDVALQPGAAVDVADQEAMLANLMGLTPPDVQPDNAFAATGDGLMAANTGFSIPQGNTPTGLDNDSEIAAAFQVDASPAPAADFTSAPAFDPPSLDSGTLIPGLEEDSHQVDTVNVWKQESSLKLAPVDGFAAPEVSDSDASGVEFSLDNTDFSASAAFINDEPAQPEIASGGLGLEPEPGESRPTSSLNGIADADDMETRMDLATAYIEIGDNDSAHAMLDEIISAGSPEQQIRAGELKKMISA